MKHMKRLFILLAIITTVTLASAQMRLDLSIIKDIVKNEQQYYKDIVEVFNSDDPYIRIDDIALVYYGYAFQPEYNPVSDENEKLMKKYIEEDNYPKLYETCKKILSYNPASLEALFYAWISASTLGKSEDEYLSYVNKYQNIVTMIKEYGNGKSTESAYHIVHPKDQQHVMLSLGIEDIGSRTLDMETLCNIFDVSPSKDFQHRHIYFNAGLYLNNVSK